MKHLPRIIALILCVLTIFSLSACNMQSLTPQQGPAGQDGKDGQNGLSAYDLAVQNGFEGSLDEWLASLKGEKGEKGDQGEKGEDGKTGKRGADGIDGKDGKDGQDGLNAPGSLDPQLTSSFVVVTEYIQPNTGKDVSNAIQEIINSNPNRTIFFPDGEYLVSEPIKTSAKYDESVSLLLSNYAEIKATSTWTQDSNTAIIMLGAANPYNTVYKPGSNYFLEGGIINGNGVANGVSIDSGRETRVEGVSIKNTVVGLHIKEGANNGSSDADILNVNIVGNGKRSAVGVLIDAHDNTLENMRITGVRIGIQVTSGGNFLRDIHPLVGDVKNLYTGSIGFYLQSGSNWLDVCYSDNFETAFKMTSAGKSIFTNCYSYHWYKNSEHQSGFQITKEIGFHFVNQFNSVIQNCNINFANGDNTTNAYLMVGVANGSGTVLNPLMNDLNDDDTYKDYLIGTRE